MRVAVVGAGNGGQATAVHLASRGHTVRLYDNDPRALGHLVDQPVIQAVGAIDATERLELATMDLARAVAGAAVVLVTVPGFALTNVASDLSPHLDDVPLVVLHPGGTGGALEFRRRLVATGRVALPVIAETDTLLYACRLKSPGLVDVKAVKRRLRVAGLPASNTDDVLATLRQLLPSVVGAESVIETSLNNVNPIVHPPIVLTNASRLEMSPPDFDFYADGVSPAVGSVMAALDSERQSLAAAWGVAVDSLTEWAEQAYGVVASDPGELFPALATAVYRGIGTPAGLGSRYLTEDVPMGLVALQAFASFVDVPTPTIDSVVHLASILGGSDFHRLGRSAMSMGLEGMTVDQVHRLVKGRSRLQEDVPSHLTMERQ